MNTASILVKTDPQVKKEAQETAKALGLSLSAVITRLLKEFVKTKAIRFSTAEVDEAPNEYFKQAVQRAQEHRREGKASPIFTDDKELLKKDPKKCQPLDTMLEWLDKQVGV